MGFSRLYTVVLDVQLPVLKWGNYERVFVLGGLRYGSFFVVSTYYEVLNNALSPEKDFVVYQRDVSIVRGFLPSPETVLGYAHTHPESMNEPSTNDLNGLPAGHIGAVLCGENVSWYTRHNRVGIKTIYG